MTADQELLILRRLAFGYDEEAPSPTFYEGDVLLSQFWASLSLLFPEGERFFVDSVRHFQSEIGDPILRARIVGFAGQESLHGKEHETFNLNYFEGQTGRVGRRYQRIVARILKEARGRFSPRFQLGITCALEHFTAILAEQLLTLREHHDALDPHSRRLWLWHALEELEHKSVAYDVFESMRGKYTERAASMIAATAVFVIVVAKMNADLLATQPKHQVRYLPFIRVMLAKPALVRRLIPLYLEYFRPSFHPHDRDTTRLVEEWRKKLFDRYEGTLATILERSNVVMPRRETAVAVAS
jgi:predicted metal-dependent hydrolase